MQDIVQILTEITFLNYFTVNVGQSISKYFDLF